MFNAIIISLFAFFITSTFAFGVGFFSLMKPLISGTIVGLILGDVKMGMEIGATINLINLGYIMVGGAVPTDLTFAGVIGTALAILSGVSAEVALTLAIPLGMVGTIAWYFKMTANSLFVHKAEQYAEQGDVNKVAFMNLVPGQVLVFIFYAIPTFISVYYGPELINSILPYVPQWLMDSLMVIGGMLPALGIAILLKFMANKQVIAFFFIGFLLATYFQLNVIAIAFLSGCVAYAITYMKEEKEKVEEGM